MGNAIWLFFALPQWFFPCIFAPFSAGLLTIVPAAGVVALGVGVVWGAVKRRAALLCFLILPAASHGLVVAAGFLRGDVANESSNAVLSVFMLLQLIAAAYLVYRLKGARGPAIALSVFSISYALFASFIATMAFSDVWL